MHFKIAALVLPAVAWAGLWSASAQSLGTLYTFQGAEDGYYPDSPLAADASGVLYGTTEYGGGAACWGNLGCGTVFSWSPVSGYSVLYRFQGGTDGAAPGGGLLVADNGAMYGATSVGGGTGCQGSGCGTVFALAPPAAPGEPWVYHQLYMFQAGDGGTYPTGNLLHGPNGSLLGMTSEGGGAGCSGFGCGTLFEIEPPAGGSGPWTERVLYTFQGGTDSAQPAYWLRADNGHYYGVAGVGGKTGCNDGTGCGTVFEAIPPTQPHDGWREQVLTPFRA